MISPETQSKMQIWRQKALDGSLSMDELKEAVAALRADRKSAMETSAAKRTAKAKKEIPSAQDLLADLGL